MNESLQQGDQNELEFEDERDDAVIGRAFKWSLAVIVILGATGAGMAFWLNRPEPPPPPEPSELELPEVRAMPEVEPPQIPFTDITAEAGIDFVHENGAAGEKLLPETMGGGCAFFDYDNDGDPDLLLVNSRRWPWDRDSQSEPATIAFYENDGSGHFENVTAEVGLDVSFYGMGAAIGDYDNDGRTDLFLSALGPNHLYRNTEDGFLEVTDSAGIAGGDDAWSTSAGWFDYDKDGDLDLFVCNYLRWSREYDLAQEFRLTGGDRAYGRPQAFQGAFPSLYRNDGEGQFTEVSQKAGLLIRNPATEVPLAKSLGVAFADFDRDGWLDIVVANDTVQNFLFHNQQDGTFQETAAMAGIAFNTQGNARGAMGIDVARFRNNRRFGVAIGNFANEMTALYVSGEELQFTDEAVSNGLGPNTRLELTFGVFFLDADLDGRLDLFAANGHLEEDIHKVQQSQFYEQPPQLFWNAGPQYPTEFIPLSAEKCGEDFRRRLVGRGATKADIDGDGDLDLLIATTGDRPRLLRNDQQLGHHWLRLKLIGSDSNRSAIGAQIEVDLPERTLRQQVMPTCSYLSQTELPVTFGLGETGEVKRVRIHWPSGQTSELSDPEVDRLHVVREEG